MALLVVFWVKTELDSSNLKHHNYKLIRKEHSPSRLGCIFGDLGLGVYQEPYVGRCKVYTVNKIDADFSLMCPSLELTAEPNSLLFCFNIWGAYVIPRGGSGGKCKGMSLPLKGDVVVGHIHFADFPLDRM